jgi:hypothetical protein
MATATTSYVMFGASSGETGVLCYPSFPDFYVASIEIVMTNAVTYIIAVSSGVLFNTINTCIFKPLLRLYSGTSNYGHSN